MLNRVTDGEYEVIQLTTNKVQSREIVLFGLLVMTYVHTRRTSLMGKRENGGFEHASSTFTVEK
ncbi:hypothetical protein [Providencia vermicola]|uniref:hypothetical protein n=1 Tax=Providencia vermicola TaxID=333965 RepID=UPI0034D52C31